MDQRDHVLLGYAIATPLQPGGHAELFWIFRAGIVTICQGLTGSFGGLVACRFLLGTFEAGFMPGWCSLADTMTWSDNRRMCLPDCHVLQET